MAVVPELVALNPLGFVDDVPKSEVPVVPKVDEVAPKAGGLV